MRVAVVGTGTEVGKTYVTCALARALVRAGRVVSALKPVESGLGAEGRAADAEALAAAARHAVVAPRYGFERALSPHLEARRVGAEVRVSELVGWVALHERGVALVETAGGLLSPLGPNLTNLDLVKGLKPSRVVLVAADRLGVLHDVGVVRRVLEAEGLWGRCGVVVSHGPGADASTGTNASELEALGLVEAPVVVARGAEVSVDDLDRLIGFT